MRLYILGVLSVMLSCLSPQYIPIVHFEESHFL
jgi:hypothetical protein